MQVQVAGHSGLLPVEWKKKQFTHRSEKEGVMRKKKWLRIIICVILAAIVCRGIVSAITQKRYAAMPCEFVMPEGFSLPDSRLVAIGTATHGNGDPFLAALAVLREMYAAHGNVALILEENVGDAETVGLQHAYSGELGENVGFYLIYENKEMADILKWLEESGQRLYGIDIQNIQAVADRLCGRLTELGFAEAKNMALAAVNKTDIADHLPLLDEIDHFLKGRYDSGALSEREYCYLLHQTDCVRQNYEYRLAEDRHFDIRDKAMAQNAAWVMDYEQRFYGNDYAVLLASNGHVVKTPWAYDNAYVGGTFCPAGVTLSKELEKDYFVIITDAAESYFIAGIGNGQNHQKIFHIDRKDLLLSVNGSGYFTVQELSDMGHTNWDMTMVGATTTDVQTWNKKWYTVPVSVPESFDAMLFSERMTAVHK